MILIFLFPLFIGGGNSKKIINRIIEGYIKTIEKSGKKIFIQGKIKGICTDKDDDDKIECAVLSDADYLITGDDDLLILKNYEKTKIITQKEYLNIISNKNGT